ncbi:hypothetical protein [Miltoncostaea oceani]|uniref:hypothetical protein n=1 Tax=Miltoncostaea oceani TaxID=2843216 RepID=UPI001C3E08A2|nr:hypothetical protein [Miltoncostaea oceani]
MHGAVRRYESVRLVFREWRHRDRSRQAWDRYLATTAGTSFSLELGSIGGEPEPEETEDITRLWRAPGRGREESDRWNPQGRTQSLTVINDGTWWRFDPLIGSITNDGDPGHRVGMGEAARPLLDPAVMLPFVDLQVIGTASVAGRAGIRALAHVRPRSDDDGHASPLPFGADEHEIVVDGTLGVLLRMESRIGGAPFHVTEVMEIAFGEAFDPAVFSFSAPAGRPARRSHDLFPPPLDLPLLEAASRAPFTVWVPTRTPAGHSPLVELVPASEGPLRTASVHLNYPHPEHGFQVIQTHVVDGNWGDTGWAELPLDGWTARIRTMGGQRQLITDRDATRVLIQANNLDSETLVAIAESLVEASIDPPTLRWIDSGDPDG